MEASLKFSTTFDPQIDVQLEKVIQILEDMLRACSLGFGENWDKHFSLVEFSYNNNKEASIEWLHMRLYVKGKVDHQYVGQRLGKENY